MALSPTIPTSFVPRPDAPQRFRTDFTGAFGFFAYGILGIVFLLAIGVFAYGRILGSEKDSKDKAIAADVASIDSTTAESFIRLSNRLTNSQSLLNAHIAASGFFTVLASLLPTDVRFSSLHFTVDATNAATIEGSGTAKNFNALASASSAFADDGRIKDAIFSSIKVNKDNSVTFLLAAKIDPKLITFAPAAAPSAAPTLPAATATTTASTTP